MMYRFKRLKKQDELAEYADACVGNGNDTSVPLDWLLGSKVFGVFSRGRLKGGFVERCPPVRSTKDIPDEIRDDLLIKHCGSLKNVQENAAFWIAKGEKRANLQAFTWAMIVIRSVFFTKCDYTLGCSNRSGITRLYKFFGGKVIYNAPSKLNPGEDYNVFIWKKSQLLSMIFKITYRYVRGIV